MHSGLGGSRSHRPGEHPSPCRAHEMHPLLDSIGMSGVLLAVLLLTRFGSWIQFGWVASPSSHRGLHFLFVNRLGEVRVLGMQGRHALGLFGICDIGWQLSDSDAHLNLDGI